MHKLFTIAAVSFHQIAKFRRFLLRIGHFFLIIMEKLPKGGLIIIMYIRRSIWLIMII